jgi:hypothetical protein
VCCTEEELKDVGRKSTSCRICIQQGGTFDHKIFSFQKVYGFNPAAPINLLPLPVQECVNIDASKCVDLVKKIHEQARTKIEKMTKTYEKHANKGRKKIVFEPGQLVWVHLRKE